MSGFVHLHLHSEYSLLDGACRIKAIPAYALAMGMKAVALTDHGAMYGAVEFYKACKAYSIKPIIGCEVYIAPGDRRDKSSSEGNNYYHLVLLCKNEAGYKNLIRMVSESYIGGFYHKPRIDMELLSAHHEGLICLSGCIGGAIPQFILNGDYEAAKKYASGLKSLFADDLYLELQDHGLAEEAQVNESLFKLGEELNIELVATNDVHYIKKKDAKLQNVLVCMQTNNILTDKNPLGFESDEYYFKDEQKMRSLFSAHPEVIDNTVAIAEKCNFEFSFGNYVYPKISFDQTMTAAQYLEKITLEGFEDKVARGIIKFNNNTREAYIERIRYELDTICSMGYAEYFLIVADYVNYARNNDILVSPGRGSGAGSLVAFLINITEVDSLEYGLLFDAFLNPERISMPDFDIDFSDTKRHKVIEYVKNKYGYDRVCQIITFGTLAAKGALRSVGKVLGMSYAEVDELVKKIPRIKDLTVNDVMGLQEVKRLCASSEKVAELLNIARQVEGMPKNISTHAAGVVICDKPVHEYLPLAVSGEDIITQYNMNDVAELGLLKFDFLGIRYLTIIEDTVKMIQEKDPAFELKKADLNDKKTYELLGAGRTDGVFQLESSGMKQMLTRFKPSGIRDIMSAIALYRPGPAKFIDKYIENSKDRSKIKYSLPALAPILDETFGCIVYQEQVMEIFRAIAGYSYGKADIVRRAISKKKADVIASERANFIEGAVAKGATREEAEALFEDMTGFADYGFKKAHAAGYAFFSFNTAYLKANYTPYYMAALLTSVLSDTNQTAGYVADIKRSGIKLLPPDINTSGINYTVTDSGDICYGLLALRNVGVSFINNIIAQRKEKPFSSFAEFIERMTDKDLNKRQVESLIKCGAFDSFGVNRSALLYVYESVIDLFAEKRRIELEGQVDLFGLEDNDSAIEYPNIPEFTQKEKLAMEKEVSGLYFSGHPIDEYKAVVEKIPHTEIMEIIKDAENGTPEQVCLCGIITETTLKKAKNGSTVAFVTLQDSSAEIEIILFGELYTAKAELVVYGSPVSVYGRVSRKEDEYPKIVVSDITRLSENKGQSAVQNAAVPAVQSKGAVLYLRVSSVGSPEYKRSLALVEIFDGAVTVVYYDLSEKKYYKMNGKGVDATPFVLRELAQVLGAENVVLK